MLLPKVKAGSVVPTASQWTTFYSAGTKNPNSWEKEIYAVCSVTFDTLVLPCREMWTNGHQNLAVSSNKDPSSYLLPWATLIFVCSVRQNGPFLPPWNSKFLLWHHMSWFSYFQLLLLSICSVVSSSSTFPLRIGILQGFIFLVCELNFVTEAMCCLALSIFILPFLQWKQIDLFRWNQQNPYYFQYMWSWCTGKCSAFKGEKPWFLVFHWCKCSYHGQSPLIQHIFTEYVVWARRCYFRNWKSTGE